jgi:hypothetical protein
VPTGKIEHSNHISSEDLRRSELRKTDERHETPTPARLRLVAVNGQTVDFHRSPPEQVPSANPASLAESTGSSTRVTLVIAVVGGLALFWVVNVFLSAVGF